MTPDEAAEDGTASMGADIDVQPGPIPISGDGGPVPGYGQLGTPDPAPSLDPSTFICKRDCRYYYEAVSHFEHGSSGVYKEGEGPREWTRACMRIEGVWLEISGDAPVLECNQWDPLSPRDGYGLLALMRRLWRWLWRRPSLAERRRRHFVLNPDHGPPVIEDDIELGDPELGEPDEIYDVVRDADTPEETN